MQSKKSLLDKSLSFKARFFNTSYDVDLSFNPDQKVGEKLNDMEESKESERPDNHKDSITSNGGNGYTIASNRIDDS